MIVLFIASIISVSAFAEEHAMVHEGPCKTIKEACEKAGFVVKEAKEGFGLWVDCIDPIMQGKPQPKKAIKPLPVVDAAIISACKTKHPKFGMQTK